MENGVSGRGKKKEEKRAEVGERVGGDGKE